MASVNQIKEKYNKYGYVICRNLIDDHLIEDCLKEIKNCIKNKPLVYTQSTHKWQNLEVDKFNLIKESILNPSNLGTIKPLSKTIKNIIYNQKIFDTLKVIFESNNLTKICSWQDMLFDRSTGTIPHIDSWYLDTLPRGNLLGAWFALENIKKENGSFYIFPKTHTLNWEETFEMSHNEFVNYIKKYTEANFSQKKELHLNKGDVVFWNSLLIHGSTKQTVEGLSRKSLTSHYFTFPNELISSSRKYPYKVVRKKLKKINQRSFYKFYYKFFSTSSKRHLFGKIAQHISNIGLKVGPMWDMRSKNEKKL